MGGLHTTTNRGTKVTQHLGPKAPATRNTYILSAGYEPRRSSFNKQYLNDAPAAGAALGSRPSCLVLVTVPRTLHVVSFPVIVAATNSTASMAAAVSVLAAAAASMAGESTCVDGGVAADIYAGVDVGVDVGAGSGGGGTGGGYTAMIFAPLSLSSPPTFPLPLSKYYFGFHGGFSMNK